MEMELSDLRRIKLKHKFKSEPLQQTTNKITSPLAKYDSSGNLSCIICRTHIKTVTVWKVHVNSNQHKTKIEETKRLKGLHQVDKIPIPVRDDSGGQSFVSKQTDPTQSTKLNKSHTNDVEIQKTDELPEKFFDDPVRDAKERHLDYKNPLDEEWDRFQREINEESKTSNVIIAGDLDRTAVERQIKEIDEQMARWTRVINLEIKKKNILKKQVKQNRKLQSQHHRSSDESDSFEEFSNWRSKKCFRE